MSDAVEKIVEAIKEVRSIDRIRKTRSDSGLESWAAVNASVNASEGRPDSNPTLLDLST